MDAERADRSTPTPRTGRQAARQVVLQWVTLSVIGAVILSALHGPAEGLRLAVIPSVTWLLVLSGFAYRRDRCTR